MKTIVPQNRTHGSAMVVSLLISAILGVTLASYLIMTQAQNATVARSQIWNTSITLTEAGVEDAMGLLNKYEGNFEMITNWCTSSSIAADNWTSLGANTFYIRRYVGSSFYDVYITNLNNAPIITAIGSVPWTYTYAGNNSPTMIATAGVNLDTSGKWLRRTVEVRTKYDSMFSVAMAALRIIDFNGKNVMTDSFDSSDPNYSNPGGLYPTGNPAKAKANGDVCTDLTIINSLNVGNAKIKGQVKTGPNGTIAIGANGSVGDKAWVEGGSTGIQVGHSANDFNVIFPDVVLPTSTWTPGFHMPDGSDFIDGLEYCYRFDSSGDYVIPDFHKGIYVGTNAHVRLKITGSVSMNGNADIIRICPGGSLKIYMVGATFKMAGLGVVNETGLAGNFSLYGLASNTTIDFNGNAAFTGTVYAPQAAFELGGGGANTYDFVGASVTKSVKMDGHYNFHYDEALRINGPGRGYVASNWKEK